VIGHQALGAQPVIDVFAHIQPPEYARRVRSIVAQRPNDPLLAEWEPMLAEDPALADLDARWASMDRFDGYRQVLVPGAPPIETLGEAAEVARLAAALNDELAELVAAHPQRFVGFVAALPASDPDAAGTELERAVGSLGALGVQLYTNVLGRPLDDLRFAPLLARAEEMQAVIWLHPYRSLQWSDYPYGGERVSHYNLYWTYGWPYETAVAMSRLVYSGTMERHPQLKVITHHGGGLVPHMAGRLRERPWGEDAERILSLPQDPLHYFRRFHADTAMMGASHALRCVIEFFGIEHVLFGSDFGFGDDYLARTVADVGELGLQPEQLKLLCEGNALRLLRPRLV
jgi:predicted TIM-barrel fold metal-dependent hydrolase